MLGKIPTAGSTDSISITPCCVSAARTCCCTEWKNPDIPYRDSLAQDHAREEEQYTLVLANSPFAGSLDYENTAKDLRQIVKTKKRSSCFSRFSCASLSRADGRR